MFDKTILVVIASLATCREMRQSRRMRGFTLIELLIIVAIIGILTVLILVSVSFARNKARDAAIRNDVHQMRILAEMAYDSNGASYLNWHTNSGVSAKLANLQADISKQTNGQTARICATQKDHYCVSAPLIADTGQFYCVDAKGKYETLPGQCPAECPALDEPPVTIPSA